MPFPMACRSLSISATSTGKSTPGRGIICRSNASPCKSTIPGNTSRPRASRPNEMTPWSEPTALIFPPAICTEVSRMVLPRSARPPSINISVTILHFVVWWINDRKWSRPRILRETPRQPVCGNRAGHCEALHVPSPTTQAPPFEELRLVALSRKIGAGAKGEVRLRRAVHGMIAGIDPRHGCDRAEPSDRGVGDLRVVHDVGIIAQRDLMQDRAGVDFAIHTERRVVQFCAGIDGRFNR